MRCWKQALEQIYDHNVNRVLPTFTPRSETEKALVDSLRQLELQCKERIDLLEALRISRLEAAQSSSSPCEGKATNPPSDMQDTGLLNQQEQGWIGNGTIPAVTYAELSRPSVHRRSSTKARTSSSQQVVGDRGTQANEPTSTTPSRKPCDSAPSLSSPEKKTSRRSSPEKHTMRTTLRTGRAGEKTMKTTLRLSSQKQADGPGASKAAMLAWSSLGQRDTADQGPGGNQELPRRASNPQVQSEQPRRSLDVPSRTSDSTSRRFTAPISRSPHKQSDRWPGADLTDLRPADDHVYSRPSPISISAASSALNSLGLRDRDKAERQSPRREHVIRQRTAPPQTPRSTKPSNVPYEDAGFPEREEDGVLRSKTSSDPAMISRRSASKVLYVSKNRLVSVPPGKSASTGQAVGRRKGSEPELASSASSDVSSSSLEIPSRSSRHKIRSERPKEASLFAESLAQLSDSSTDDERTKAENSWKKRKAAVLKKLPPGVDQHAAKQILNEIIVHGDEVRWSDIAGLEVAKNALRETVVYPFLRPDLFMGLREPARGMLLFGPPGTGKTMLARAVATESQSTFFSISASSLTSKYLGESEKLVRALFALAKALAPSIIFVDEIDSLLSQRSGSGEHEATRRIKTEFLIQWSDLQRAAAGREVAGAEGVRDRGDANQVLVLAATNLPWAIDEAARRRFVRRQYIPLPEAETRAVQLRTLLKQQKHTLTDADIDTLVGLTEGKLFYLPPPPPPLWTSAAGSHLTC